MLNNYGNDCRAITNICQHVNLHDLLKLNGTRKVRAVISVEPPK